MAEEGKGVAMAILGVVAVIAVVGLVLLFSGASGKIVQGGINNPNLYTRQSLYDWEYGPANVEHPGYAFEQETYSGKYQSRYATGKEVAAGGAWDPSNVYGDGSYDAALEPSGYGLDNPYLAQISENRAPSSIASDDNSACGFCPKGSTCQLNDRRVPSNWRAVDGYPGCYVVEAHS